MRTHQMVEAGEEVRVFDVNGKRVGQPEGGWIGNIVKAGPKLVTITYGGRTTGVFRRDDGRANDKYGHQWYLTLDETDRAARRDAAVLALRSLHIDVSPRCALTVQQLEAMVLATVDTGEKQS